MKLEENIEKLNKLIEQYQNTSLADGNTLIYLAQQIAGILYWLSEEKTKQHTNFEKHVYVLTTEQKLNVNRATNLAEVLYPNLYKLRYIIKAGYSILDIIRTQISYLKNEMINIKN
jgi:hypothetical protein